MSAAARLVRPALRWRDAFLRAARDHVRNANDPQRNPEYTRAVDDFDAYLASLARAAGNETPAPGMVRQWNFWLVAGGEVVGQLRLRERLTTRLAWLGGHIGYDVPPSQRRKGYATRMLKLGLAEAAKIGLGQAMLTADAGNAASIKVIERNGGTLDAEYRFEGRLRRRYWAPTPLLRG